LTGKKNGKSYDIVLYVDGKKQLQTTKDMDMTCFGPEFFVDVGVASKTFTEGFIGNIDNIKIFDKMLNSK